MNGLVYRTTRLIGAMLLLAFVLTGCRTYGGYNSTVELHGMIQEVTVNFAADYGRAEGERDALRRAAAEDPALAPLAERFAAVVEQHGAVVEEHRALAEAASTSNNILFAWVGPDAYRSLHRTYGALISDQQVVEDRYGEVLRDVRQAVGAPPPPDVQEEGRYQIAPHFYNRIEYALHQGTVADILAQAGTADTAASDTAAPETIGE